MPEPAPPEPAPYRKPDRGPDPPAWDNLVRWQRLTDTAQTRATSTAQTWRNGLAGFITLLTSALILKGSDIGLITAPWNYAVIALFAVGLGLSFWGLWAALAAEAPEQASLTYDSALTAHGSIAAYEQSVVSASNRQLARARWRVFLALAALLAGSVCWWLAPAPTGIANLRVVTISGNTATTICGEALPSADGELLLRMNRSSTPTAVPLSSIRSLTAVASCEQ